MSHKAFMQTAGLVFLIVAGVHLLRVLNGWPITVNTFEVPMWISWVAFLFVGYLSFTALKKR